jgi:hypothetical protein
MFCGAIGTFQATVLEPAPTPIGSSEMLDMTYIFIDMNRLKNQN